MDYLGLIPLFVLGLAMIIKPEYLWEVEHIFTVDGAGPTGLYLTFIRVSGTFFDDLFRGCRTLCIASVEVRLIYDTSLERPRI